MFYTIYQITNIINGAIYIGKHQTTNLNDGYMGSGKHLKRAIIKYGIENFKKEILYQFDTESEMNLKESELVTVEFVLREDTYNLCVGGHGGFSYIRNHANYAEWQSKGSVLGYANGIGKIPGQYADIGLSAIQQKIKNDDGRLWYTSGFKHKHHTDEHKLKQSEIMKIKSKGSNNSQYGTMWITNGRDNKKIRKDTDHIPDGWYKGRAISKASNVQ